MLFVGRSELQKLLECVDYGERLRLLCRLLKREEVRLSLSLSPLTVRGSEWLAGL